MYIKTLKSFRIYMKNKKEHEFEKKIESIKKMAVPI